MAWWIKFYLLLYVIFAIAGMWDDYKAKRSIGYIFAAGLSNVVIVGLFVALLNPEKLERFGMLVPWAFVAAMCWEVFQFVEDNWSERSETDRIRIRSRDRRALIVGVLLYMAISLPAFIVAGISAFKAL